MNTNDPSLPGVFHGPQTEPAEKPETWVRHEMQHGEEAPSGALGFRLAWNGRKWKPGRSMLQMAQTIEGAEIPVLVFELVDIGPDEAQP